jgi:hypothetical protein
VCEEIVLRLSFRSGLALAALSFGAVAQTVLGEIGVQHEEIPFDANLGLRLKEANQRKIPIVLVTDPSSLAKNPEIKSAMQAYDTAYYLNCGLIMPWDTTAPTRDPRWQTLVNDVCPQKTRVPPLNHEWTSVSSAAILRTKTLATVEDIRMRMLNDLAAAGDSIAKAEDSAVEAESNESRGVNILTAPIVANTNKPAAE